MIINSLKKELNLVIDKASYAKQAGILFVAQIGVLVFGVLIKTIQTRALTIEEYGTYAFFGSITSFMVLFYRFGFYTSLKVLLANTSDTTKSRELIGTGVLIAFGIGVSFSLSLFGLSYFVDELFNVEIGKILLILSPLCFVLPFKLFISEIAVGTNKVSAYAIFDLISSGLFLAIIALLFFVANLSVTTLILYTLLSISFALIIALVLLKPIFQNINEHWAAIVSKNKEYGWHYYTGAITNQSTFKLDELFITYFINASQLGFYTLANMICAPMSMMSAVMSKSIYKRMASLHHIPKQVFVLNLTWLLICIVILYFVAEVLVSFLFGQEYADVAVYVIPLSFAHFFQGLSAPYSFLSVKSKGKEIRNIAFAEAIINVVGNLTLIPTFGVTGAIIASIIARFVHYAGSRYYYKKYLANG